MYKLSSLTTKFNYLSKGNKTKSKKADIKDQNGQKKEKKHARKACKSISQTRQNIKKN